MGTLIIKQLQLKAIIKSQRQFYIKNGFSYATIAYKCTGPSLSLSISLSLSLSFSLYSEQAF